MTISTTTNTVVFTGNGVTTTFPFTFYTPADTVLVVKKFTIATEVEETLSGGDYTITLNEGGLGGEIEYPIVEPIAPLTSAYKLIIERVLPVTQTTSILNQSGFNPAVIEAALDTLTMLIQQVDAKVDRTFVLSAGSAVADLAGLYEALNTAVTAAQSAQTAAENAQAAAEVAAATVEGVMQDLVDDTSPTLGGDLDVSTFALMKGGQELLRFTDQASAVNEITLRNAPTGQDAAVLASGGDTNIGLNLVPKGTGRVKANGIEVMKTAVGFAVTAENGKPVVATGYVTGHLPFGLTITEVIVDTNAAPTGSVLTLDVKLAGNSIFTTKPNVDIGATTSAGGATPGVINAANAVGAKSDRIQVDIPAVDSGATATGVKVWLVGYRTS